MTVQFAPQLETVVPIEKVAYEKRSRSNWNTNEVEENSLKKANEFEKVQQNKFISKL